MGEGLLRAYQALSLGLRASRAANDLGRPWLCQARAGGPGCGFPPTLTTADRAASLRTHSRQMVQSVHSHNSSRALCASVLCPGPAASAPHHDGDAVTPGILGPSSNWAGAPRCQKNETDQDSSARTLKTKLSLELTPLKASTYTPDLNRVTTS